MYYTYSYCIRECHVRKGTDAAIKMKTLLNFCWIVLSLKLNLTHQLYVQPIWRPFIEFIPPSGIRFIVVDVDYILVAFHYSINVPLYNVEAGRWNFDVTEKTGNEWVHENRLAGVRIGDTVNYWINVRPNLTRIDEHLLNQSDVIEDLSATVPVTKGSTTAQRGTTGVITSSRNVVNTTSVRGTNSFTSTRSVSILPATSGPTSISRDRATSTAIMTDIIRSTTLKSTSDFNDYPGNSLSNFTYLIVFSTLGVMFMLCITVIAVCCIRHRRNRTHVKEPQSSNEHFKSNLSNQIFQGQRHDRDNRNWNMNVDHATTRNIIPGTIADQETPSRIISRHVYDAVDYNVNPVESQYDYTDSKRAVYDMPKDFLNQFKPGNKYGVLSRNRVDNEDQYQTINNEQKPTYLELV